MADLGAINVTTGVACVSRPARVVSGTIFTPVGSGDSPHRRKIVLHLRSTYAPVSLGHSLHTGEFIVASTMLVDTGEHYVVAFDDEGGNEYNAVIFDRVIPVTLP